VDGDGLFIHIAEFARTLEENASNRADGDRDVPGSNREETEPWDSAPATSR